jgi:hypothetical protein
VWTLCRQDEYLVSAGNRTPISGFSCLYSCHKKDCPSGMLCLSEGRAMLIGAFRDVCQFVQAHDVIGPCIRQLPFTSMYVKVRTALGIMYKETTTAFSSS